MKKEKTTGVNMDAEELKKKKLSELHEIAKSLNIPDYTEKKKQELVLAILESEVKEKTDATVQVSGVLEVLEEGFGFLRSPDYSYLPSSDDIYVAPSQIKKFLLKTGDTIVGQARPPKNSERYFALLRIETVNNDPLTVLQERLPFDELTPLYPQERIRLEIEGANDFSMRIVDLFIPIGKG
ncbi:MAG: Rho termination factor N-terminal domain-containing protein, partial [candidate division WOR-3 bacterium]|nr:Rho termination factor N-terminal domain-containing protein [candidate division WOR-3 bacterium]